MTINTSRTRESRRISRDSSSLSTYWTERDDLSRAFVRLHLPRRSVSTRDQNHTSPRRFISVQIRFFLICFVISLEDSSLRRRTQTKSKLNRQRSCIWHSLVLQYLLHLRKNRETIQIIWSCRTDRSKACHPIARTCSKFTRNDFRKIDFVFGDEFERNTTWRETWKMHFSGRSGLRRFDWDEFLPTDSNTNTRLIRNYPVDCAIHEV